MFKFILFFCITIFYLSLLANETTPSKNEVCLYALNNNPKYQDEIKEKVKGIIQSQFDGYQMESFEVRIYQDYQHPIYYGECLFWIMTPHQSRYNLKGKINAEFHSAEFKVIKNEEEKVSLTKLQCTYSTKQFLNSSPSRKFYSFPTILTVTFSEKDLEKLKFDSWQIKSSEMENIPFAN